MGKIVCIGRETAGNGSGVGRINAPESQGRAGIMAERPQLCSSVHGTLHYRVRTDAAICYACAMSASRPLREQLRLPLTRHLVGGTGAFVRSGSNAYAMDALAAWPSPGSHVMAVCGPAGCGKSHLAVDPDHALGPQSLDGLEAGRLGVEDQLGQAVVVAQVDEQQTAVVALAVDPAREAHIGSGVSDTEGAAGV